MMGANMELEVRLRNIGVQSASSTSDNNTMG
ncbi:MAG: hypothetical protein PWR26_1336 [Methanosarcinales archaeon]|nr:hypothetical protein [Methanosarcinales archaeon]